MVAFGIVGAGRAAALHAEAVRLIPSAELAGVCGQTPGSVSARRLASAHGCPVVNPANIAAGCDVLILATPPRAHVAQICLAADTQPLLVESPVATRPSDALTDGPRRPLAIAANLLHAPVVRRGLDLIGRLVEPHHLQLTASVPTPSWGEHGTFDFGGGVMLDPGALLLPTLLAALGDPVVSVSADLVHRDGVESAASLTLSSASLRHARASLRWRAGPASAALEAADSANSVRIEFWPTPRLEHNGVVVAGATEPDANPIVELGFVAQLQRMTRVLDGAAAWPDLAAGAGVVALAVAAATSEASNSSAVRVDQIDHHQSPVEVLRRGAN